VGRRNGAAIESVRNIARLLVLESGVAFLIAYLSIGYGEGQRPLVLVALVVLPLVSLLLAVGLWKFRDRKWIRWVATTWSILVLLVLSIVVQAIFPLMIMAVYHLGVGLVLVVVFLGIVLWIIGSVKERARKNAMK